jgi:hypothetical protein
MPANLTPQYSQAEEEYKKARTPEEKLAGLKKMLQLLPKHKGTEKIQAELKSKISDLRDELEREKKGGKKGGVGHRIPRQGAGQIVLLGAPNVGKSRLLSRLTKATPEVAAYPFTTREPQPGMMAWQDVAVQLIDTPPVTADFMEGWLSGMVRAADAAALVADLGDDDVLTAVETVISRLAATKTRLVGRLSQAEQTETDASLAQASAEQAGGVVYVKTLMIANKSDAADAQLRLDMLREAFGAQFPIHPVDAEHGAGLEELRDALYQFLDVIRVYTKQPGKPPDLEAPFTCRRGGTVYDLAGIIHRELQEKFKSARIWGTGVYDGQTVKRDHVLHDRDVIEIHS